MERHNLQYLQNLTIECWSFYYQRIDPSETEQIHLETKRRVIKQIIDGKTLFDDE
jgi:hypothetical protein